MSTKIEEALEHIKTAQKYLKTSVLRWKPDFDSAADEFCQAAQCYRIARDLKQARDCYYRASESYKKNRSFFHAAKALEQALLVGKELSNADELFNLALEASSLYQQHGSGDSAAGLLDKAGRILEQDTPQLAVKLYQHAADISANESSQHQGIEYISKASRLLVRLERYDEAVDNLRREIGFHLEANNLPAVGRLCVAIVLVQLARGDTVAAEKSYKEWGGHCEMAEVQTLDQLLQAYDEEDPDSARKALRSPFIRSMDVEYSRLANCIPLPEPLDPMMRAGVRENAAPSYVSPNASTSASVEHHRAYDEENEESPYEPVTYGPKKIEEEDEDEELC
ncbi:gamma-soluble NSF attachment protein-like [Bombyx mandarina]|uniref:Gamma-soluble NSF attachment protein n=2 Tax=Bombyx TaxID=7090 RepID=A0A8R1WPC6_BOMMO|nr:gamma-soluble NSF attachment protein [Bombyx mori]XP_028034341.1 gamma-soluble NSF attachment protein-like [Bombyx mandarina]